MEDSEEDSEGEVALHLSQVEERQGVKVSG
jgi:hypothetical protein